MQHPSTMRALLCLALQMVTVQASPAHPTVSPLGASDQQRLQRRLEQMFEASHNAEEPRRMYTSYPSTLLQKPEDCSDVDVLVYKLAHIHCQWAYIDNRHISGLSLTTFRHIINASGTFIENLPQDSMPPIHILGHGIVLNLTKYSIRSVTTQFFENAKEAQSVVVYTSGSQTTYVSHQRSPSFGCANKNTKYSPTMFAAAEAVIDKLKADNTVPELVSGPIEIAPEAWAHYESVAFPPGGDNSKVVLAYQNGKLIYEKYDKPASKTALSSLGIKGGTWAQNMFVTARTQEGKLDLDGYSLSPELTKLQKKQRNMTVRNTLSWRLGRALEAPPWGLQSDARPAYQYDEWKMWWCVLDKTNYAVLVPESYADGVTATSWSKSMDSYDTAGTAPIPMRDLRLTFPETSDGFSDYAAYPWTQVLSQIGANDLVIEADASGIFQGQNGLYGRPIDFLKLGVLFLHEGKHNGKQILDADWIRRNFQNPYTGQNFIEGYYYAALPGGVTMTYMFSTRGVIVVAPAIDLVMVDILVDDFQNAPHRLAALTDMLSTNVPTLLIQLGAAMATTSTTTEAPSTTTTETTVTTTTTTEIMAASTGSSTGATGVVTTMTVQNVDYAKLQQDSTLLNKFTQAVKRAIADHAGENINEEHVEVALSAGSVVVTATITPPSDVVAADLKVSMQNSLTVLGDSVTAGVSGVAGIDAATTGTVSVSGVTVATVAQQTSTILPSGGSSDPSDEEGLSSSAGRIGKCAIALLMLAFTFGQVSE